MELTIEKQKCTCIASVSFGKGSFLPALQFNTNFCVPGFIRGTVWIYGTLRSLPEGAFIKIASYTCSVASIVNKIWFLHVTAICLRMSFHVPKCPRTSCQSK